MDLISYLSFGVSPLLIIIGLLILRFNFHLKHLSKIWFAIALGFFSIVFIFLANYVIDLQWDGNYNSLRRLLFFVIVIIAFSAELGKYLILRFVFYNTKGFNGPLEGIVYAIFIGLGFSTAATVLFGYQLIGKPLGGYQEIFLIAYPFATIVFAICMGFFIGMGKIRKNTFIDSATGLFVAIFFHGLFYFSFISRDMALIGLTIFGSVLISLILLARAIKLNRQKDD